MIHNFPVAIRYIAKTSHGEDEDNDNSLKEPKLLGLHPDLNEKVVLAAQIFFHTFVHSISVR